ncbi:MAG: hypothetical protein K6T86_08735 [Pirellulales bacterium]|nr:hypothetical protein [Pirellulales bacterium]
MPFIVQCPHQDCRKYMLLEDHARGQTVECLICKHPIKVEGRHPGGNPTPHAGSAPSSNTPGVPTQQVVACPHCSTPLRLPPGNNPRLRCGRCSKEFAVRT